MKKNPNKAYPKNPIKFLWLYALKNKALVLTALSFALLEIITEKLAPFFFSRITGLFGENVEYDAIKHKLFLFLGLFVFMQIINRVFYYLCRVKTDAKLAPKINKDIEADMLLYLQGHSVEYFANNMAGKLADKAKGIAGLSANVFSRSVFFLKWCFDFVATSFMFLTVNSLFASMYAIVFCLAVFIFLVLSKKTNQKREALTSFRSELSGLIIDSMQNNFFVKIFNGQKHEEQKAKKILAEENKYFRTFIFDIYLKSFSRGFVFTIINLGFLIYALFLWKNGVVKIEDLVFVIFLIQSSMWTMNSVLQNLIQFNYTLAEMAAHLEPFSAEHDIKEKENAKKLKIKNADISFENITFGYNKKANVFKNFNLSIAAGEKVGIVGASGCGKTTLINLLQRLYELNGGKILIDGKDIVAVSQDSLCQNISYVSQHSQLFKRSIKENICYGKPNANEAEIINASKNAYAHSFIAKLESGYNTILKGDKKLSGGEMQRITIARALLENAPILILDEATSSLDSTSEQYIQKAIAKLIKNKTVIAIAHRLSTLKNMDRIIVIDDGKIIEDGSINKLLKNKGKFFEFWNMQKMIEEKEGDKSN